MADGTAIRQASARQRRRLLAAASRPVVLSLAMLGAMAALLFVTSMLGGMMLGAWT